LGFYIEYTFLLQVMQALMCIHKELLDGYVFEEFDLALACPDEEFSVLFSSHQLLIIHAIHIHSLDI